MIEMDYSLAMAASRDAGNREARSRGLEAWDEQCWEAACRVFLACVGLEYPESKEQDK